MDGTANEIDYEGMEVQGFPTIFFFKAGDKAKPINYEGAREIAGFVSFLAENAANPIGELATAAAAAAAEPAGAGGEEDEELGDLFGDLEEGDFEGDEYEDEHAGHDHDEEEHDEL